MESQAAEITGALNDEEADAESSSNDTDGSAPSGNETAAAKTEAKSESPDKKRDEVNERFDKLTRDLYELRSERDRDRYELSSRDKRIAELEAELGSAKRSQVAPDNLPTLESVGYDETKYTAALAAHFEKIAEQKGEAAAQKAFEKYTAQLNSQRTHETWEKREADFIKSHPEYVEKVAKAHSLPISHELQQELKKMDDGPQLALHLVENQDKAVAIMRLPLPAQMLEIGRIQGLLAAAKQPPKPPVSLAPPPPPKVESDSPTEKSPNEMTDKEFANWRRRQIAQRR